MIDLIKNALRLNQKRDVAEMVKYGAVVVDVRTPEEYSRGHIKGSINIPFSLLGSNLSKITDKNKPVITVCVSGKRSGAAKEVLQSNGFRFVFNAGNWSSLQRKIA